MNAPIVIHIVGDESQREAKVEIGLALAHALKRLGYETTSDEDPILVRAATKSFSELEVTRERTGTTGAPAVGVVVRSRKPGIDPSVSTKPRR